MLHECWDIQHNAKIEHSSASEIIRMAKKYSITNFGLIHVNPNCSKEDEDNVTYLLKDISNAKLLNDGDVIVL